MIMFSYWNTFLHHLGTLISNYSASDEHSVFRTQERVK
jgi:hypothetical protein